MELTREQLEILTQSPLWAIRADWSAVAIAQLTKAPSTSVDRWEAAQPSQLGPKGNKVAIVPIEGVLTMNGPSWYGSNYNTISRAVTQAANDPDVKRIVLQVDSPGGQVTGLPETADLIQQAARIKPVDAMVEGMSASAAYYLASQARDIVLTPSGEVGSVGVRMMHTDISKLMENWGITVTELHAGEYKTEWSPFKPLSDDAKENMQSRLDDLHSQFIGAVAAGRGPRATDEITSQRFGEGRMFSAKEAQRLGLVDKMQAAGDYYRSITPTTEPETPRFGLDGQRKRLSIERGRFSKRLSE
jgi:signal peptide peptidase SppA